MSETLVSARCVLTSVLTDDIDTVYELCQDPEIQNSVPIPSPYGRENADFFVRYYIPHGVVSHRYTVWALRADSTAPLLGVIELRPDAQPRSASLGCWLGAPSRGRGLMAEALGAVIRYAFSDAGGGFTQLRWEGLADNESSVRLAARLGFTVTAIHDHRLEFRGEQRDGWLAILSAADYSSRVGSDG
jgi:RimJ/RimL family protein N-acetyltransferase